MNSEVARPSLGGVTGLWENLRVSVWSLGRCWSCLSGRAKRSGSVSVNGQHFPCMTRASLDDAGRDAANHPSHPSPSPVRASRPASQPAKQPASQSTRQQ